MKNSKLLKNLLISVVLIIGIYTFFFLFVSKVVRNEYYQYKYNTAYEYIITNPNKTLKDFLNFSFKQGFYVANEEDKEVNSSSYYINEINNLDLLNTDLKELHSFIKNNRLYIGDNKNEFYVYINPNIIKDIASVLNIFATVTFLLFLLIVAVIYFYMNYKVVFPLNKIAKYIRGIEDMSREIDPPKIKSDDEIKEILDRILELEKNIKIEIFNRNAMLKSISHEFRTPLSHITTILWLYENKSADYGEFSYAKSEINKVIEDNKKLIDMTLDSLNVSGNSIKESVDLSGIIKKQLELFKIYLGEKEIFFDVDDMKLIINPVSINLIINNIISNAAKYSNSYIKIYNEGSCLFFVNDYTKENNNNGVGKSIINTIVKIEKIEMNNIVTKEEYITKIKF